MSDPDLGLYQNDRVDALLAVFDELCRQHPDVAAHIKEQRRTTRTLIRQGMVHMVLMGQGVHACAIPVHTLQGAWTLINK
jgi:hypothetical protein